MENETNQNTHQDIYDEMHDIKHSSTNNKSTKRIIAEVLIKTIPMIVLGLLMFYFGFQCGRMKAYCDVLQKQIGDLKYRLEYRHENTTPDSDDIVEHSLPIIPEEKEEPKEPKELEEGASLGIKCTETDRSRTTPQGVVILEVYDDSAAENAGLQSGDIITNIDWTSIITTYDLERVLKYRHEGDTVKVEYFRLGPNDRYWVDYTYVTLDKAL